MSPGKVGLRLSTRAWRNPRPQLNVKHIDYVAAGEAAAPFCVAATCG